MNHRRRIIESLSALPLIALLHTSTTRAQTPERTKLSATPQDALGPFYPKSWSGEVDADLLSFAGKNYGEGTSMRIDGVVRALDGSAIAGAQIEIWQVDASGKYRHPNDDGEGPAQRGFQGYGRMRTDQAGRYSFRTIKPIGYGGRPAHVHFRVVADNHKALVTQMYFAGESEERGGFGFGFSKERDKLTVKPVAGKDGDKTALVAAFDIVLARS